VKNSSGAQSATSLPRAPQDEVSARSKRYLITMGIRIACLILMVAVQPYGWYTWLFAAGAIVLPYIAVVAANVGQDGRSTRRSESPERALSATASPVAQAGDTGVVRIVEQRSLGPESARGAADAEAPSGAAPSRGRDTPA
jgi:hypothetical protein